MPDIINSPTITGDEKVTINRKAIEHRAVWMGLAYEAAKRAGADAENIWREAVSKTGCLHGAAFREKLDEPLRLDEFAEVFLPPLSLGTFEMEVTEKTADTLSIRFHYCPLVAGWLKADIPVEDIPTLCDIAMDGDRNIAEAIGADFTLGDTIAGGCPTCELRFSRRA